MEEKTIVVVGSQGTIGSALCRKFRSEGYKVLTISRSSNLEDENSHGHLVADSTQPDCIAVIKQWLIPFCDTLCGVINCVGALHHRDQLPEKNLSQITDSWLLESVQTNVLSHIHVAQAIKGFIKPSSKLKWISLSAKVGSIEDNQLGGWYSYRMSKAALNMFIKTLSIEWKRYAPGVVVTAVHPGTTKSYLSEPFTKNLSQDRLYSESITANRIFILFESLLSKDSGKLFHHDGSVLAW